MVAPRYTVIIPMHRFGGDEPVLHSLREMTPDLPSPPEIFVVEGTHPSRQRNAALERAQGEIIVFLDNDCRLTSHFWEELDRLFNRPDVDIVGGPVLLRPDATPLEQIFHALLTHPLVVGPVSVRYRAQGEFRTATQTELILCNMAARRSIFTRIGTLSTNLYPNEENEWLERVQVAGAGIFYDPQLQVFRPQRESWGQFLKMLLRYGSGRTRQFWVSGWRATRYQFTPLILLVPVGAALLGPTYLEIFFGLWLLVAIAVALTCQAPLKLWQRVVAVVAAPLIPFNYALGQLIGWPALLIPRPKSDLQITLLNERGERIE
jgi:succinoglycan biosynthesis protein ExoA